MENPKQISCKISLELDYKIREYVKKHEIKSTSELVKSAIEYFLEHRTKTITHKDPYFKSSVYKRPQEEIDRERQIKSEIVLKIRKEIIQELVQHLRNENHSFGNCSLCDTKHAFYEQARKKQSEEISSQIFLNKNLWFENGIKWKVQHPQLTTEQAYQKALAQGII